MEGSEGEDHPDQIPLPDDSSSSTAGTRYSSYRNDSLMISTHQSFDRLSVLSLTSPTYESPAAFENYDFEFLIRWYRRVWSIVLGFAGVLDILAYSEPMLRDSYNERCIIEYEPFGDGELLGLEQIDEQIDPIAELFFPVPQPPRYCSPFGIFLDRLKEYHLVIAFSFSFLWFLQSHSKAREAYYYQYRIQEDRMQLSAGEDFKKRRKFNATRAFYRRMLSRMLLLPVGYYVINFHLLRGLMNGQWLYRQLLINPSNKTAFLTIQDPSEYVTIEITEKQAKMSTIFAIFIYLKYHFMLATSLAKAEFMKSTIPRLKRKLVGDAVRNPRKFIRKLKKIMRYVRWIKYIIPLVAKLNKFRANTVATLRKRHQYRMKRSLSMMRMSLLKEKSQSIREKNAAILIQQVWRAHFDEKLRKVAMSFTKDKRTLAAMKIQAFYRRMALNRRIQNSRKMRELVRLKHLKRQNSKEMNDDERRRLYQLQDEFITEAKKTINKRLLLRPNTRLSVIWNSIFIFCVILEISHNALRPWLLIPKAKRANGKKYRSQRLFLAEYLTPTPVEETDACKDVFKKKPALQRLFFHSRHKDQPTRQEVINAFVDEIIDPDFDLDGLGGILHNNYTNHTNTQKIKWRCREPISTWRNNFRDIVQLTLRPDPVSEWPACQTKEISLVGKILSPFRKKRLKPLPWYCTRPYCGIHNVYRRTWNFIIDQVQGIISVICFFDVFVKFFTGEFDPITGELQPKGWFRRWILPGLLLQLLVNPAIGSFSTCFFTVVDWIMVVGPVRVLRWFIAVVVPMVYGARNIVLHWLQEAESDHALAQYRMLLWEYSG
eukprot:CAMPEP_0116089648 /NCGR_PEP_ID=MMETSP0327-20121206/6534_1 /TAXON_ID=44447 /ORGANISM="Pseudo-nitzschia delicatissima, Strain B596" /LENGTH=826 /DNA_ID=CAMNT_0003580847 /DNA_START=81 /DNA_END=2561 /DNA_ORIENTATION=-